MTQGNASGVYISEFMASEKSRPHDWLEVYNSSSQAVDISGWGLSDDAASPRKWRFPQGTVIQPGDYLTLYLSGTEGVDTNGVLNASFRLSADGGYGLTLSDASGALLDRVFVPEQYTGISYARMEGRRIPLRRRGHARPRQYRQRLSWPRGKARFLRAWRPAGGGNDAFRGIERRPWRAHLLHAGLLRPG